jgi:hypothetical protein
MCREEKELGRHGGTRLYGSASKEKKRVRKVRVTITGGKVVAL